jgi:5'(3')-deoxyribonucleotidase
MRIAIDMDDVIADCVGGFLNWYERDFGVKLSPGALRDKTIFDVVPPAHAAKVRQYANTRGFFRQLATIDDSQPILRELNEKYDFYIVTLATEFKYSLEEKHDWLEEHFPFISWKKWVFCGDKSIIRADVMIDDNENNLRNFQGRKIMFSAPHNASQRAFEKVDNWEQLRALL